MRLLSMIFLFTLFLNIHIVFAQRNYEAEGMQLLQDLENDKNLTGDVKGEIALFNFFVINSQLTHGVTPTEYSYLAIKSLYLDLENKKTLCNNKNFQACLEAGLIYSYKILKYDMAHTYFDIACKNNIINGCANLSTMYILGLGVNKDYNKAKAFSTKACDGGDAAGCNNLGYMYHNNLGIDTDYNKALSLYKRACKGNDSMGCNNFKDLYDKVCLTNPKKYCSKYE